MLDRDLSVRSNQPQPSSNPSLLIEAPFRHTIVAQVYIGAVTVRFAKATSSLCRASGLLNDSASTFSQL